MSSTTVATKFALIRGMSPLKMLENLMLIAQKRGRQKLRGTSQVYYLFLQAAIGIPRTKKGEIEED
jgi:hypothetical protein